MDDYPQQQAQVCKICGCELEWEHCWNGCDDGWFDGYAEDPLWYDPGDYERCTECNGEGGYLVCPNAENHAAILAEAGPGAATAEQQELI